MYKKAETNVTRARRTVTSPRYCFGGEKQYWSTDSGGGQAANRGFAYGHVGAGLTHPYELPRLGAVGLSPYHAHGRAPAGR